MGKFVIKIGINDRYYFSLKADNGQNILASESYMVKFNCRNGIESVRVNAQNDRRYDKRTSANGKHYFNLKAPNGRIIGTSGMYENESARDNGIDAVKSHAPDAEVVEE